MNFADIEKLEEDFQLATTPTPMPTVTPTPTPSNVCTPTTTVTEGDLFPGGIVSFGISSGAGSVTVDHVNAETGLQLLTIVGTPINAIVNIPAFAPGTTAPVVVTFTPIDPNLPIDFTLRTASTFHATNIRVRCGQIAKPELSVIQTHNLVWLTNSIAELYPVKVGINYH